MFTFYYTQRNDNTNKYQPFMKKSHWDRQTLGQYLSHRLVCGGQCRVCIYLSKQTKL